MSNAIKEAIKCVDDGTQEADKAKQCRLTAMTSAGSLFQTAAAYAPLCKDIPTDMGFLGEKVILGESLHLDEVTVKKLSLT